MASLTDRAIQAKKAPTKDEWLSDSGSRGAGRLYVRIQTSGGKRFYYRYSGPDGARQALVIGDYSQKGGHSGLTLLDAREKAGELARLYQSGIRDLRGHFEAQQQARERAQRDALDAARRADEESKRGSLRNLLNGYTDQLERAKKTDVRDVKGLFRLHVFDAFPNLADRKANEIKSRDLRQVLAKLIEADKGRTAGKLRSYMRAAFASAIRAENDPTAPASLLGYGIEANPCDALPALSQFLKAGDRTLTDEELGWYINGLEHFPAMTRDALKLALYLGGQRPSQLLRITPADVDLTEDSGEVRLRDGKGARKAPRLHVLPLVGVAHAIAVRTVKINGSADYLFSNTRGTHVRVETMSEAAGEISEALMQGGRIKAPFQLRDIRRTCETMMASMGISKDLRAQLLSHGLGGVQQRHYDRHGYTEEKRTALKAWDAKLEALRLGRTSTSNVVNLETARAA